MYLLCDHEESMVPVTLIMNYVLFIDTNMSRRGYHNCTVRVCRFHERR